MLRKLGKKIFFVTNNSTKSRKGYKGKFESLGLNVEPEEIFSSSFAAAAYSCRADVSPMNRGDAAAATWLFRGTAATPRPRRGYFAEPRRHRGHAT